MSKARIAAAALASIALASVGPTARAEREQDGSGPAADAVLKAEDALDLAVRLHPSLRSATAQVGAAEARAEQAGLLPNPELQVDVENVGVEFGGFDASEVRLWLTQRLEIGGKRPRRRASAEGLTAIARQDLARLRLEIETETAVRLVDVWLAQERYALAQGEVALIARSLERLRGTATAAERARGEVALGRTALDEARARAELEAARLRLAASWGGTEARFLRVEADLEETPDPSDLANALAAIGYAPAVAGTRAEVSQRREQLRLARSGAFPDLTLSVGYRRFAGVDANAAVFSVGVPIPLFDRNQGETRAVQQELLGAEEAARATRLALHNAVIAAHTRLKATHGRVGPEREALLGDAERAWRETRAAYARGEAPFVALLDARRVLFEVRERYLEALQSYHLARIDLEHLLGTPRPWACDVTEGTACPRVSSRP